jgi:hypothetical protein
MEAKLIKDKHIDDFYYLKIDINTYATTDKESFRVLSLKNCQAIERGYDLDELDEKACPDVISSAHSAFKAGFQKALELNNTKLYTLEDMMNCWNKALKFQDHKETLGEHIQSIQQTEWDVEIEMENVMHDYNGNISLGAKFKLDADGCLILKLKSE